MTAMRGRENECAMALCPVLVAVGRYSYGVVCLAGAACNGVLLIRDISCGMGVCVHVFTRLPPVRAGDVGMFSPTGRDFFSLKQELRL